MTPRTPALLAALLLGCSEPSSLVGAWEVESIGGEAPPAAVHSKVRFTDSRRQGADVDFAATAGCNSVGGSYRLERSKVEPVGIVTTTLVACSGEAARWERAMGRVLARAEGVELRRDGKLRVFGRLGEMLLQREG